MSFNSTNNTKRGHAGDNTVIIFAHLVEHVLAFQPVDRIAGSIVSTPLGDGTLLADCHHISFGVREFRKPGLGAGLSFCALHYASDGEWHDAPADPGNGEWVR